ncbi:MAG: radical SAM protein [Dehalococcoidia bacterium]
MLNFQIFSALPEKRLNQRILVALRHFTFKKAFNICAIELQLFLGLSRVRGYPFEWEIDTTNICQLKCPLCHTGLGNINRVKGIMHFDTFKKTIDEIKDYVIWLSLYSWGEPFLNKHIPRFIEYAHQANVATIISTNLSMPLSPERVEAVIKSGLDVLIISLDGVTQEVYETYRVGGNLSLVLKNIQLLVQKRKELGYKTPYLEWQFIVMRQNEHQIPEARRMAKRMGMDSIVFKRVDFPFGETDPALAEKWLPSSELDYRRERPFDRPYSENDKRCWRLWRSAVVNWDGGYAPCCYLTDAKDDFGNVNNQSIKEIWKNEHYLTARNLFRNGEQPKQWVGCINCDVYLNSRNGRKHALAIVGTEKIAAKSNVEEKASN